MKKILSVLCFVLVLMSMSMAQRGVILNKKSTSVPEGDVKTLRMSQENDDSLESQSQDYLQRGVVCRWYGHGFVYLTSRSGIRVAIDPFGDVITLPFPKELPADVVLISYESSDRGAGERLVGTPQVFRGATGVGLNRASGILFRGVQTYRDTRRGAEKGVNTVYVFELDGLRFCALGGIGHVLNTAQREAIGRVDVVFLPVGNRDIPIAELLQTVKRLEARYVVPLAYQDAQAGTMMLRSLEDFTNHAGMPVKQGDRSFVFRADRLPVETTVVILEKP